MSHSHYNNQDFGSRFDFASGQAPGQASVQYSYCHQRPQAQANLFDHEEIKAAIGSATHDELIDCNNKAYMQLYVKATKLRNEVLQAQKDASDAFRDAYESFHQQSLSNPIPRQVAPPAASAGPSSNIPFLDELNDDAKSLLKRQAILPSIFRHAYTELDTILKPADYPNMRFWTIDNFKKSHKQLIEENKGNPNALAARMMFMEDEHGGMLSHSRLSSMRALLKSHFNLLSKSLPELIQGSWEKYDHEIKELTYKELRAHFPELRLCDGNWKSRQLMIEWHTNWDKPFLGGNIKSENIELSSSLSLNTLASISASVSSTSVSTSASSSISSNVSATASSVSPSASPSAPSNGIKRPTTSDHVVAPRKKTKYKNKEFTMPEVRNPLAFSKAQYSLAAPTIRSPSKTVSTTTGNATQPVAPNTQEVESDRDGDDLDNQFEHFQATDLGVSEPPVARARIETAKLIEPKKASTDIIEDRAQVVERLQNSTDQTQVVQATPNMVSNKAEANQMDMNNGAAAEQSKATGKARKSYVKKKSNQVNAKALCGNDWVDRIRGTCADFEKYWKDLGTEGQKPWFDLQKKTKNQKGQGEVGAGGEAGSGRERR